MADRKITFSEMAEISLMDLLNIYVEAKKGEYIELTDVLTTNAVELINELDQELNNLIND